MRFPNHETGSNGFFVDIDSTTPFKNSFHKGVSFLERGWIMVEKFNTRAPLRGQQFVVLLIHPGQFWYRGMTTKKLRPSSFHRKVKMDEHHTSRIFILRDALYRA
jgi:hypothetical protein